MSRRKSTYRLYVVALAILLAGALFPATRTTAFDAGDLAVYADSLSSGWQDWSWGEVDRAWTNGAPVHGGNASIAVTYTGAWSGLQLGRLEAQALSGYDTLRFWVHGGTVGGQKVTVTIANDVASVEKAITPQPNVWTRIDLSIATLQPGEVTAIKWFNATAGAQSVFYLDDLAFVDSGATPPPPSAGPALTIDAQADRHLISPYIYGMNYADEALAKDLRLPVRRWGGNATTRYNWQNDTSNRASDYFFENIPESNPNPETLPNGSSADRFVEQDRRTGTATLMTIPMTGWVAKGRVKACGFSVQKYGAQRSTDPWMPDCGDGVRPDGQTLVTGNDPTDTSISVGPQFVKDWIRHLQTRYGTAANGGVKFYNLDNEPMLWNSTHRDVHPAPTSYDEMRDRTIAYASAIKAVDGAAQTLGPAEWGWTGYFWSALDSAPGGSWWLNPQDRRAHGDVPFVAWYLQQMRAYEQQHGQRILDYLDLHNYPQSGVALSSAGDAAKQALRLRSTRSLWDPTYTDESWIAEPVRLIPRMRDWVAQNYPGTKLAIGEYNWGALDHINGALAQADILGIFGREGVDLATLWDPPTATQPGAWSFRMYRNYDGAGASFGETSVRARSADQDKLAVYGATRSRDGALTLMVINKTTQSLTSNVALARFSAASSARVYRYAATNVQAIVRQNDQQIVNGRFATTFPPSSVTLFVIPSVTTPTITGLNPASVTAGDKTFGLVVDGTNFTSATKVRWNGSERTTRFVNATQLVASIRASDLINAGRVNISVVTGTATSPTKVLTIKNLLLNGSFETDANADTRPDSWTGDSRATHVASVRRNGAAALRMAPTAGLAYGVIQSVGGLLGGRGYILSGWVNAPAATGTMRYHFAITWRSSTGAIIRTDVVRVFTDDTAGAWTQQRSEIVSPAGTAMANIRVIATTLTAPVYVDDVAFHASN